MCLRILEIDEIGRLIPCLNELAKHHNQVSNNFKGRYPSVDYEISVERFKEQLLNKETVIAVIEEEGIAGFCKVDILGTTGKLDYLVVREMNRGKGYGKLLMDWAIKMFDSTKCSYIEVKVVDGNDAIRFYENYGFQINAHILRREI